MPWWGWLAVVGALAGLYRAFVLQGLTVVEYEGAMINVWRENVPDAPWRWSVIRGLWRESGQASDKELAIAEAKKAVDNAS